MKLLLTFSSRACGGALLTVLVVTACIGIAMGSYLQLVQSQNRLVMYSMTWNEALPMAEAGVEEAMTHLVRNTKTNWAADGWSATTNSCLRERALGDGYYHVTATFLTNTTTGGTNNFRIRSTGYVLKPGTTNFVARTVVVNTASKFLFLGIVTKTSIDIGGNFYADSYDSSDTNASTGGLYDPAKLNDEAFIGTNSQTNNSKISGSMEIFGTMATGPGGSITAVGGATVGSEGYAGPGIEPGRYTDDLNVPMQNVSLPTGIVWAPASSGTVNGTNYAGVLTGGYVSLSSLNGKLYVSVPTTLYVSGGINLDTVIMLPGAKLTVYAAGTTTSINGTAGVNAGGDVENFNYYGLPTNTRIDIQGGTVNGTIYAPNADIRCGGDAEFFGGIACNSLTGLGNFIFHYDEKLGKSGDPDGFVLSSWDEATTTAAERARRFTGTLPALTAILGL